MIHYKWNENKTTKKIICKNIDAKKFKVNDKLTVGETYEVKNETDEFYFIIDNSNRMAGFYKNYFKELK